MASRKTVLRVLLTAKDRATMLALLRDQHPDVGGSAKIAADGSVRIDAYVAEDRVDALKREGVTVEVVDDHSAQTQEARKFVGTGNRFKTGDPVPHGLGVKTGGKRDVS